MTEARALRKLTWKEERELEGLETRIHALEEQVTALHRAIDANSGDYVRLQELAEQLAAAEVELDEAMGRWLEMAG